jgi:hypothetical protein
MHQEVRYQPTDRRQKDMEPRPRGKGNFTSLLFAFLSGRTVFRVTPFLMAIILRLAIPKPFHWIELLSVILFLLLWPNIELAVHHVMHQWTWTATHKRHKHHHAHPNSLEVFGTYLFYNLIPVPWFLINWAWAESICIAFVFAIMIYEFVHFSVHYPYRPLTDWGRRVRENHLLHHRDPTQRLGVVFPGPVQHSHEVLHAAEKHP